MQILDHCDVNVWHLNTDVNMCIHVTIKLNERCGCMDRTDLGIHCKRAYNHDGKLDINKYDS